MSTRMPRPMTASAAATVNDINANSWPSRFWSCRLKVIRVRLTAFSISSMQTRMTIGFRRTSIPTAPMVKRSAPRMRNQEVSRVSPPRTSDPPSR